MSIYIAIALGGSLGAISRYWVSGATYSWLGVNFPYGTLMVNVAGSLVMGFLTVLLVHRFDVSDELRLGLLVGFLGSFTTFSAFSMDTVHWMENGELIKALVYVLASVVASSVASPEVWSDWIEFQDAADANAMATNPNAKRRRRIVKASRKRSRREAADSM